MVVVQHTLRRLQEDQRTRELRSGTTGLCGNVQRPTKGLMGVAKVNEDTRLGATTTPLACS